MFQIISMTGEILAETDSPIYTKFNPDSGAWIPASEVDAECVVVDGKRCVVYGKPFAAGTEKVVFIKKLTPQKKFLNSRKIFLLIRLTLWKRLLNSTASKKFCLNL